MTTMAWHFVGDTLRDGRPVPPDGEWLVHEGVVVMCKSGLHASRDPFDALRYAPGPILCRVECRGVFREDEDKLVCSERRIVQRADATEALRYFARMQALSVIHLWTADPPDVVLDYLMTGDESARAAAWDAGRAAAWTGARAAAWAAWAATRAAAGKRPSAAAWDAAQAAAWSALQARPMGAAKTRARAEFNALVKEAFS